MMEESMSNELTEHEKPDDDEGVDVTSGDLPRQEQLATDLELIEGGVVRTLDGDIAGDEFQQDAQNYKILLAKIDNMMEELGLDG